MTPQNDSVRINGLLIAAGASTRLGQPKQLVNYQGQKLINYTISELLESDLETVTVILGSNYQLINREIYHQVPIWNNINWEAGMGTSIAYGVSKLMDKSEGILISLVDQYMQDRNLINELIIQFKLNSNKIIASEYGNGIIGVPAIFPKNKFNKLIELNNDRGAGILIKAELQDNSKNIELIKFSAGDKDIDTPEDLMNLG